MDTNKILDNLNTTNHSVISTRYHQIVKTVNRYYWDISSDSTKCRYVGSYGRGTAIKGFSDVDIIVKLPATEFLRFTNYKHNGQSALLQNVKNSILFNYPRSIVKGDGQVVKIEFSDGIKFEIVPVFENEKGVLIYPDANNSGEWKECNPVREIEIINLVNRAYEGKVKQLCKLTRAWKVTNNINISGILIDTLATTFILNKLPHNSNLGLLFCKFLLYMVEQRNTHVWSIPGSNDLIQRNKMDFEDQSLEAADKLLKVFNEDTGKHLSDYNLNNIFGKFANGG